MTIRQLATTLGLQLLNEEAADREVTDGYCGDLLSWVMGRAPHDSIWVTIMSNRNVIAVAVLAEIRAILFAEGVLPDEEMCEKAKEEGIALLTSEKPTFELAGQIYTLLRQPT
jgi:hypothetical protein